MRRRITSAIGIAMLLASVSAAAMAQDANGLQLNGKGYFEAPAVKTPADSAKLPFMLRGQLAAAAAWSPNPKNPPLYLDLPIKDGVVRSDVLAKWAANAPLAFVDQFVGDLRRYKAIDVGDKDGLKSDAQALHAVLDRNGIENSFEIYDGDHTDRVAWRFQDQVMPFFDRNLDFATARQTVVRQSRDPMTPSNDRTR